MIKILSAVVILYTGCFALLWALRLSFIYPLDPAYVPLADTTLRNVVEKTLHTPDGETLIVWVARAPTDATTLVYFPGNAGNLGNRVDRLKRIQSWGFGFVALAYRGSSGSSGTPNERAISQDAIQLVQSLPELLGKSPRGPIVYYGESLGTGVAAKLSTSHPPDGLVLEAPFTSMAELASRQFPMFPVKMVLEEVWNTQAHIKTVKVPLLAIHGTDDAVIPYDMGKAVVGASPSTDKKLVTVQGGTHHNLWTSKSQRAIYDFVNRL